MELIRSLVVGQSNSVDGGVFEFGFFLFHRRFQERLETLMWFCLVFLDWRCRSCCGFYEIFSADKTFKPSTSQVLLQRCRVAFPSLRNILKCAVLKYNPALCSVHHLTPRPHTPPPTTLHHVVRGCEPLLVMCHGWIPLGAHSGQCVLAAKHHPQCGFNHLRIQRRA